MSNVIDDRRGLIFTINGELDPVYQVESSTWAQPSNRCSIAELPAEIQARIASLKETSQPGAFVKLVQGEVGVYVLVETNIKRMPEAAAEEETILDPSAQPSGTRALAPYDIVVCSKQGAVHGENGEIIDTQEGDCYVLNCQSWGRFFLPPLQEPAFVTTTKSFLLLLEQLHDKNFLSMCPDPAGEALPPDFGPTLPAFAPINCYVLNLSSFQR